MGADAEGFGDADDGAEGWGGVAAFDVAPVAGVYAGEFGGLGLVEGWVVFLAEAREEGAEVGTGLKISFRHIVNLSVSLGDCRGALMGCERPVRVLFRSVQRRWTREGFRVAAQEHGGVVVELFGGRRPRTDEPRVTKKQVAAHFGVSTKTIDRYMRRPVNPLPFEKPFERGAVRFVMSEVEAWWRTAGDGSEPSAAAV